MRHLYGFVLVVLSLLSGCAGMTPQVVGHGEDIVTIKFDPAFSRLTDAADRAHRECLQLGYDGLPVQLSTSRDSAIGFHYATYRCTPKPP